MAFRLGRLCSTGSWGGLGAPFQASALENQHRYVLLIVNALLVGAGFIVQRDALRERSGRFYSSALFAAAIPASGLYVTCIAITLAQATMAVQGDHTPVLPLLGHLYGTLEFFNAAAGQRPELADCRLSYEDASSFLPRVTRGPRIACNVYALNAL